MIFDNSMVVYYFCATLYIGLPLTFNTYLRKFGLLEADGLDIIYIDCRWWYARKQQPTAERL